MVKIAVEFTEAGCIMRKCNTQILTPKAAGSQADTSGLKARIDKVVYELYGLTEEEVRGVEGKR